MIRGAWRYAAIGWARMVASVQLELEYPVHFVVSALHGALILASGLLVLEVVFEHAPTLGGWTRAEALVLFGVFLTFEAFVELVLHPNLDALPELIRTGELDHDLLKPVSTQFLVSTRRIGIWHLGTAGLGIAVAGWGLSELEMVRPLAVTWALLAWVGGAGILYSLWLMVSASAFWFVKAENASVPLYTLLSTGRFPVTAFPTWVRLGLTFVIPIATITNVPAAIATQRLAWTAGLGSLVVAGVLLAVSRGFWRWAVSHYTSASS